MAFAYSPKIVTDGLVLYLDAANPYSYVSGSTAWNDISRSQLSGSLINEPAFSSANNGSIVFDGVDDYGNLGNVFNNVFAGNTPKYTFSIWVKFNTLVNNTNYVLLNKNGDSQFGEDQRQVGWTVRNLTSFSYNGFQFESIQYNTLYVGTYRLIRTSGSGLTTNTIYNLVGTFDSSIDTNDGLDRVNLYVNSIVQPKVISFSQGSLSNIFESGSARIGIGAQIGANINNSPLSLLNGTVYSTQIYNRALSSDEVLQNYNATKGRFGLT